MLTAQSKFIIDQPHRVVVPSDIDLDRLKSFLTFTDKTIQYDLQRLKKNSWLINKYGEEYYLQQIAELKAKQKRCLLYEENDVLYTYSGLAYELSNFFGVPVENTIQYPEPEMIPWAKEPEYEMRPYQKEIVERLLQAKHGSVSAGTGLGKSLSALNLIKRLGLPTLIIVPNVSIASQMYKLFVTAFGKKYVGQYGDGKKQYKSRIVIGLAQALTRLQPEDPIYQQLADKSVVLADESHTLPAVTFENVFMGIGKKAPYRFSFSATQTRNDGSELLLKGLIGPIVYNMTVKDGVDQGYLAKPLFYMVQTESNSTYLSDDPNAMERKHLLTNPRVIETAAAIANQASGKGMSVLILIDEFEQAVLLDKYISYPCEFAHGGVRALTPRERAKERRRPGSVISIKDMLPAKWHKSDVFDQVNRFNQKQFPILIGTSAIGLGTDVQVANVLIVIQKGRSEIKFKQTVGRGMRRAPGKDTCLMYDFDIVNIPVAHRHAKERAAIYNEIYGPVNYISVANPWYK